MGDESLPVKNTFIDFGKEKQEEDSDEEQPAYGAGGKSVSAPQSVFKAQNSITTTPKAVKSKKIEEIKESCSIKEAENVKPENWSVGSEGHPNSCKPCAWQYKRNHPQQCSNGEACLFCHFCDGGCLKRKKRKKVQKMKAEKEQRKQQLFKKEPSYIQTPDQSRRPSYATLTGSRAGSRRPSYATLSGSRRPSYAATEPLPPDFSGMLAYVQPGGHMSQIVTAAPWQGAPPGIGYASSQPWSRQPSEALSRAALDDSPTSSATISRTFSTFSKSMSTSSRTVYKKSLSTSSRVSNATHKSHKSATTTPVGTPKARKR